MWHFLFALFLFWGILIKFRLLIFFARFQSFGNSTLGLPEEEKLAGSGGISLEELILEQKRKKMLFHFIYRLVGARLLRGRHTPFPIHSIATKAKLLRIALKKSRPS